MPLEHQVPSLEPSKRLKELGVPQESLFWWSEHTEPATLWTEDHADENAIWDGERQYSAFTVAELGEMFKHRTEMPHWNIGESEWQSDGYYDFPDGRKRIVADTEADARAKMLIYLLENKLIAL